ncbi:MAG: glycosyltransferase family 9 protein [Chlorobiota bacterium]|nr:MAG: glycosyltransferase family 9 protein [Chlorobiota bacterium]
MARSHPGSLDLDNNRYLQFTVSSMVFILKWLFRPFASRNNDILVISFNNIGDSILSLPALQQLKKENPGSRITILTYSDLGFLFGDRNLVDSVVLVERSMFKAGGKIPTRSVIGRARECGCGTVINFSENPQSVLTMVLSGGRRFYGIARKAYAPAFDRYKTMRDLPHLQDIYFDAVESYKTVDREAASRILPVRQTLGDEIIITPFAGWDEKMWGLARITELAVRLSKKHPVNFVVEKGKLSPEVIRSITAEHIVVTELSSIAEYLKHLESARLLVANDTGPIHLAAWYGIPTVAIFGPTNPDFCKQPGDHHLAIFKELHCTPKRYNYCELGAGRDCPVRECLNRITVDEVEAAVLEHLGRTQPR